MTCSDLPHANSYYAATARDTDGFPVLEDDIEADIAVVGGGFSGVATALELAERGLKVTLLEANRIGWGATGRNGGQITGSLSGDASMKKHFARQIGEQAAEDYIWNLRWRGHEIIKTRVGRYDIECDLRHGHVQTAITTGHIRELEVIQTESRHRGMGDDIQMLDKDLTRKLVGSDLYIGGLLNRRNMHVHALDLCVGEARAVQNLGGLVFERSQVLAIEHSDSPVLHTDGGTVRAKMAVLAGNAYHRLEPRHTQGALFPASLSNCVTEPLPSDLVAEINPQNYAVYDCRFVLDYFRLTPDHRLMFGSGTNYTGRADTNVAAAMLPALLTVYPQLKGYEIDYAWSGMDGITANRIPQLGRIGSNVFFAQGYSGHGIALSHISGRSFYQCDHRQCLAVLRCTKAFHT